ncbi:MAG: GPP34 family phosphoprotein [Cytophagales bacterium]|nr:GPP34 family phosphoprotein [Cytophagales bacterium]
MKLSIAEGLYLIALDDEEGRLLAAAEKTIIPGLLSAIVLEMYIQKKISLSGGHLQVVDSSGTGNGVLDKVLQKLHSGTEVVEQIKELEHNFKDIMVDLNSLLAQRGILQKEKTKLLWIPLSERMDNANYAFEEEIRNNLKAIVFKSAKPSPSFAILMSLIYDCNILEEVFPDRDDLVDAIKVAKDMPNSPILDQELSAALLVLKAYFGK